MTLHIEFPRSHMLPSPLVPRDPPGERVMRLRKSWHNQSLKAARPPREGGVLDSLRKSSLLIPHCSFLIAHSSLLIAHSSLLNPQSSILNRHSKNSH